MLVLKKLKKLFPIGSPKVALNSKRTPEFVGTFKFQEDDEGNLSINKFIADYNYNDNSTLNEKLIATQDVIKLFR